ncbi:MAG: Fic family protein [Clostridia bacterium]|nr:Fic family protein [Clostridia bacterium]
MDRERLFRVIGEKYIARNELYGYLPLGVNADEIWSTVLEQRRAKAITLPLTNAKGEPYWYTLTDKMIIASENIVNELYENDYTDKLLSSVMTIREIFFTGYLEGSQISAQEAVSFLQRGEEALDAEELMIFNNRQAGSFAAENIYRPLNRDYLQVLAQILTNGLDNGGGELRTEDSVDIYFMQGESYVLPSAARLNGCINEITSFLADMSVHPLIKAAVAQAWAMVVRPFPDGNERLGMKVAEHDMSTQVNFLDGYISPNDTEQTEGSDE